MKYLKTFELIEAVVRAGSIRKAAEDTNLTASALNRRIQNFEQEFGWPIFERLPRGMRLNPAGELLMHHIGLQRTDLARVQSQVADLSGERRGHVSIACSQALLPYFLPEQIAIYRAAHPGVTFTVNVRDRAQADHRAARRHRSRGGAGNTGAGAATPRIDPAARLWRSYARAFSGGGAAQAGPAGPRATEPSGYTAARTDSSGRVGRVFSARRDPDDCAEPRRHASRADRLCRLRARRHAIVRAPVAGARRCRGSA